MLEARRLLSGGGAPSPSGLPLLHSFAGAPVAIFLDFDGDGASYSPYDTDGDPNTFGPAEQDDVRALWRQVSVDFSMFDLDVTTEPPGNIPYSYSIISNSVRGGSYNQGGFPSSGAPSNIHGSLEARNRPTVLSHELGHSFGLEHQSVYDQRGHKLAEYHPGHDALHGAIMGVDTAQRVTKWFVGQPSSSAGAFQDDVAIIAAAVARFAGGDGMRPDDYPNDLAHAQPMTAVAGGGWSAAGVIERLSDEDPFSFVASGGGVRIDLVPPQPSALDATLEVYGPDGALVAAADGAANDAHLQLPSLPEGTYRVVVGSHGDFGDLGPYDLTVREVDAAPVRETYADLPAPPRLQADAADGTSVALRWDGVAGAAGYAVERSDDGLAWRRVYTAAADDAEYLDIDLPGGRRLFYRVSALDGSGGAGPGAKASAVTRPAPPTRLDFCSLGAGGMVLTWRESTGETGYRVERLRFGADGSPGTWEVVGEAGANAAGFIDPDVTSDSRLRYRVVATSARGDSAPAETGADTPLKKVGGLKVVAATSSAIQLTWDPITCAVRYDVERSADGVTFERVASVNGTAWTDPFVLPLHRYSYRVVGTNDLGASADSDTVSAVTRAPSNQALPAGWGVVDVGADSAGGAPAPEGVASYSPDSGFSLLGFGSGFTTPQGAPTTADAFRMVCREITGDFTLTARVALNDAASGRAVAGLIVRDGSSAGGSPAGAGYLAYGVATDLRQYAFLRTSAGGYGYAHSSSPPGRDGIGWLRLVRTGRTVTVYGLSNNRWQTRSNYTVPLAPKLLVGMFATPASPSDLSTARIDNVELSPAGTPTIDVFPSSTAVTALSTLLSVRGNDDGGEAQLTYTWSVLSRPAGSAAPLFGTNGTNAAKTTSVLFKAAGRYVFRVEVRDRQGLSTATTIAVDVAQSVGGVLVVPPREPVALGQRVQLAATFVDQFGAPYQPAVAPAVQWTVAGADVGAGEYVPPTPGWKIVTARVNSITGSANLFAYDPAAAPVILSAASRKVHGAAGPVDLPLSLYGGPVAVEPRAGGPTLLQFELSAEVFPADGVLDASEFALRNSAFVSAQVEGRLLSLVISGVKDGDVVSITVGGLVDAERRPMLGGREVSVRARRGDVDGDGVVTAADAAALRSRLARPPRMTANWLEDLDLDGVVDSRDLALVRRLLGRRLT